jgi:hypothetical protein
MDRRPGAAAAVSEICPTCGQRLPDLIRTADQLVTAMRDPTRDVYEGYARRKPTGRFYISYGGGEATRAAVEEALRRGLIRLKYDDVDGYWCLADA